MRAMETLPDEAARARCLSTQVADKSSFVYWLLTRCRETCHVSGPDMWGIGIYDSVLPNILDGHHTASAPLAQGHRPNTEVALNRACGLAGLWQHAIVARIVASTVPVLHRKPVCMKHVCGSPAFARHIIVLSPTVEQAS